LCDGTVRVDILVAHWHGFRDLAIFVVDVQRFACLE
jgi:hypothetical protein